MLIVFTSLVTRGTLTQDPDLGPKTYKPSRVYQGSYGSDG